MADDKACVYLVVKVWIAGGDIGVGVGGDAEVGVDVLSPTSCSTSSKQPQVRFLFQVPRHRYLVSY